MLNIIILIGGHSPSPTQRLRQLVERSQTVGTLPKSIPVFLLRSGRWFLL